MKKELSITVLVALITLFLVYFSQQKDFKTAFEQWKHSYGITFGESE